MTSAIIVTACLCVAQPEEPEAVRARIAIAIAIQKLDVREASPYEAAYNVALSTNQPLLIGVGCDPPKWAWHRVRVETLADYNPPTLILAVPIKGQMMSLGTLNPDTTADKIRMVYQAWSDREQRKNARAQEVARPSPFSGAGPTADSDSAAGRRWEWSDEDVPEYMTRYTPAKYTQEIAVTNGRDRISRVDRRRLKQKWQAPGGLAGIDGWVSELWQWSPRKVWVGNIPVLNSFGYFQNNRGWKVSYEPGTEFLDVLRNTESGKVFEVRKAMKTDAGWQRFVTYRNADERPHGYHGPKGLNCHNCHNEAGTGGYGTGLVPGGDTVLSVPFEALE